jgi:hypothetical protein
MERGLQRSGHLGDSSVEELGMESGTVSMSSKADDDWSSTSGRCSLGRGQHCSGCQVSGGSGCTRMICEGTSRSLGCKEKREPKREV